MKGRKQWNYIFKRLGGKKTYQNRTLHSVKIYTNIFQLSKCKKCIWIKLREYVAHKSASIISAKKIIQSEKIDNKIKILSKERNGP